MAHIVFPPAPQCRKDTKQIHQNLLKLLQVNDKEKEMYLRKVTYQLGLRLKSLVPRFHKSHLENLALLVIGIAYSRSVSLPKAAGAVPYKRIQVESRVERFERLLQCEKLLPLDALKPVARKVLKSRSEEHTSELQSLRHLVCRLLL